MNKPKLKTIAIITSGGDAPGMNAAIRACTLAALQLGYKVYGFKHGYNGLINNEFIPLEEHSVRDIIHCGGTILKSARSPEFTTIEGRQKAANNLNNLSVDALIVIGGDGSFNGLIAFQEHYNGQLIGLPGTIDNDVDCTDYTIGFATAVDTAIDAIDKIRDTADAFERIFIVEVMGRHSGFLALNVGVASGAEQVITFENFKNPGVELKKIAEHIKLCKETRGPSSYLIVAAENLWPGGINQLSDDLGKYANISCTPCVLGYIQRGGVPVAKDRILATKLGVAAITSIKDDKTMLMIGEVASQIVEVDLSETIKQTKTVDKKLLTMQDSVLDIAVLAKHQLL